MLSLSPLLPREMQSIPLSASSTQHMWELIMPNDSSFFIHIGANAKLIQYSERLEVRLPVVLYIIIFDRLSCRVLHTMPALF